MRPDREPPRSYDHALRDGTTVHLRPIRPDDGDRLLEMWGRTSEESRRMRFMGPFRVTHDNISLFTHLDPDREHAQVATMGRGPSERIIGVARYVRDADQPDHAEFAALVEDAHQGRGIGTALVRDVATRAAAAGVRQLTGDILASNARMLNIVRDIGLSYESRRDEVVTSVVRTDLELELTERFLRVQDRSEREAATAAVRRFLHPRSIAVVGASRDRRTIGGMVFHHLVTGGYEGVVYPVNRAAVHVQGVAAYPALAACPDVPELVVVCVPAAEVEPVVDEAGRLGVHAACVISAGFSESGPDGERRQDELLATARSHGMRIVGPNCMGLMNAARDVRMNATFSTIFPEPGRLAFSSQSGALGLAVLEHVHELGLGISTFISVGNKADISGNDLLVHWEDDPATDVILLYLESFGNPRKFSRTARRISRRKPIVAVKSGRTTAGARAAASHTAAMAAGDVAVEALFTQTGVIRTDTLAEMFDVATLLSCQPLPRGRKVAIVTNAGGPGTLAADACEARGLEVPRLSAQTTVELEDCLPTEAGVDNPVDLIASASAEVFERSVTALGSAHEVDAVFVIFVPAGTTEPDDFAAAIRRARSAIPPDVPIVSVFMSARGVPPALTEAGVPSFAFPEDAARALGHIAKYAEWRSRPLGTVVEPDGMDRDRARRLLDEAIRSADAAGWLHTSDAEAVLAAYGVTTVRSRTVEDAAGAAEVQRELGCPVAVKTEAPIHKTDVGAIELDLRTPDETAAAVDRIAARLSEAGMAAHADRYLVQEMVEGSVEMMVGVSHDPSFGPLLVTGMGGRLVELLKDVAVRITPVTDVDVEEMIGSLRMQPVLSGYRGSEPTDVVALKDLLHRVNALVEDLPEVRELDINPVFLRAQGQGAIAVDVRLRAATPPSDATS